MCRLFLRPKPPQKLTSFQNKKKNTVLGPKFYVDFEYQNEKARPALNFSQFRYF